MKFEHYLENNAVPEWFHAYVTYADMKKLIRTLHVQTDIEHALPYGVFIDELESNLTKVVDFDQIQMNSLQQRLSDIRHILLETPNLTKKEILQIKNALLTLHKAICFLANYKVLNKVAFYKITKKFDKKFGTTFRKTWMAARVDSNPVFNDTQITAVKNECESLLINKVYNGDVKRFRDRLRKEEYSPHPEHGVSLLHTGLLIGTSLPLITEVISTLVVHGVGNAHVFVLLHIHGSLFLLVWIWFGIAICYHVWKSYRINYAFVMEFDARSVLTAAQFAEIGALLLFAVSLSLYLSIMQYYHYYKWTLPMVMGVLCLLLFFPFHGLRYYSRKWFLITLTRILLPGVWTIKFSDFFIADLMCSLTFLWTSFYVGGCYYFYAFNGQPPPPQVNVTEFTDICSTKKSWIPFALAACPFFIRAVQCLRRIYDDPIGNKLQWINFGKYIVTVIALLVSSVANIYSNNITWFIWIGIAIASTCYSTLWDIFIDWGLYRGRVRILPRRVYVWVTIVDVILRFAWFTMLNTSILVSTITWGLFLGLLEVSRRTMWALLRIENEHANNIENYRAFYQIPLPFHEGTLS